LTQVVIDASVAAKWFVSEQEPFVAQARSLLGRYDRGEIIVALPDLFWAEIANFFWKAIRTERFTERSARTAIDLLRSKKFLTVPSLQLLDEALHISLTHNRSTYDCLYIALAQLLDCGFVTADERLVNAVGSRLPVKWLGAM
jgi:predicted nucleic acid-binding protein